MDLVDERVDLTQELANVFQFAVELCDGLWCSADASYLRAPRHDNRIRRSNARARILDAVRGCLQEIRTMAPAKESLKFLSGKLKTGDAESEPSVLPNLPT